MGYLSAFSQERSQISLLQFANSTDSIVNKYPAEKLYIQFDKPNYATGDTIWLKAYLFYAPSLLLSAQSGVLHIDIANDSDKVVRQYLLPVVSGVTWGNIGLDKKDFLPGNYILRAYTNWMRNFGNETFFYKRFSVLSLENRLLVSSRVGVSQLADHYHVNTILKFTDGNSVAASAAPMQLQVMSGDKRLYKQKLVTDDKGLLNVNFDIPLKAVNINVTAEDEKQPGKMLIPINLNRTENADVQFLPEGGNLIAGVPAHIGFKAIGEDGKGLDIFGAILDKEGTQVASFKSLHEGMGSFDLDVKPGEVYTAKITLPGGEFKNYQLPPVKSSGTALRIINNPDKDSLDVIISVTGDISALHKNYFLVTKARGVVCYTATFNFDKGNFTRCRVAKSLFPTGIAHFALMTTTEQPLNERLVFIEHSDALHIGLIAERDYTVKDSIALHLSITDDTGNPVQGNFSLAVTDDSQVKQDTLSENIVSRLWLTSDLKGYIEQPGYYFSLANPERFNALDNLLLTQGWVSYQPVDIKMSYSPETEYTIRGIVKNELNGAVIGTHVQLLSRSPFILMDTTTNDEGRFVFHHFAGIDTPVFILKAVNRKGRSYNVDIRMDNYMPPVFNAPGFSAVVPWYLNSDSTTINYVKYNTLRMEQKDIFPGQGRTLNEVQIKAKKIVKGSANLNGPGNADIVLDEKDLEAAGKKTWLQLLQENVKGFGETLKTYFTDDYQAITVHWYFLDQRPVSFIIDGIKLTSALPDPEFIEVKNYLQTHTAEDIKGIEVMSSAKYVLHYGSSFNWGALFWTIAYIEITTRSGHGAFSGNTPGMYQYKPLALSYPKEFYKPKYALTDTVKQSDLRSTIDWEPNITTDSTGKATVSFYAASEPSTYSVIVEGTDFNGNTGYKLIKVKLTGRKETTKSK